MDGLQKYLRVLVVDDDDATRESFRAVLEYWGYDVWLAATGSEAICIASDYHPSVVFLDLGIRGSNVYDVIRSLNQLPLKPFIAVVSGFGADEDRKRSADAGADLHLVKPANLIDIRELLERLSRALVPRVPA
jgi:two-component system, sensor histidine kinase